MSIHHFKATGDKLNLICICQSKRVGKQHNGLPTLKYLYWMIACNLNKNSHHTKLVLLNTLLLIVPIPILNNTPPAKHRITLRIEEFNGVIIGTMLKNNIPTQREARSDNHNFCLPMTLISTYIGANTAVKNIFESKHITIPLVPAVPESNGNPDMKPPRTAPTKKEISIHMPTIKPIRVFDMT